MVDALSRKVHSVYVASISTYQSDLRKLIVSIIAQDELYVQIKDKLQQIFLEKRYEGYHLEGDKLIVYKNKIYIPNVVDLRIIVMDEIHKIPYSGQLGYLKTIVVVRKQYFFP